MTHILAITTVNNTVELRTALAQIEKTYGGVVTLTKLYCDEYEAPDVPLDAVKHELDRADIVLVDIRGEIRVGEALPGLLADTQKTVVVLIGGGTHIFALTRMGAFRGTRLFKPDDDSEFNIDVFMKTKKLSELTKKLGRVLPVGMLKDMRNWVLCQEYYAEGDVENLKNMLLLLLKYYGGVKEIGAVPPPKATPSYGLYLPHGTVITESAEYKKRIDFDETKQTIGILMYQGMHFSDTAPLADELYDHLRNDVNLICVASKVETNLEALQKYLTSADLLINLQYFRIHGGPYGGAPDPTYDFLTTLNVPLLAPLRAFETELTEWKKSNDGVSPLEIVLGITLPELDGSIEPFFVSALDRSDDDLLGAVKSIATVPDRVATLADRIRKWLALRRKENGEKKLALITYDYPPGEESIGNAGYLDVFASLDRFLDALKSAGYSLAVPKHPLKDVFLENGIANSPTYTQNAQLRLPLDRYVAWFRTLPEAVQRDVERVWGPAPGTIMVKNGEFIIPGMVLDNVFLGVQPARGVHGDIEKAYHDKELPPPHQYLAYYYYLEHVFGADAVVHFGMHGTLEFTKGKEVALSSGCFPDVLIGTLPHVYYYWVGNTSESTIAKRRSYALCVSHASPPMQSSGLYDDYVTLEELLAQLDQTDESKKDDTRRLIDELAAELHFEHASPAALGKELRAMKRRLIPHGLHVIDVPFDDAQLVEYVFSVLRTGREFPPILHILAAERGLRWDDVKETAEAERLEDAARRMIGKICTIDSRITDTVDGVPASLPDGYAAFVRAVADNAQERYECQNLLRALNGEYIFPAVGGDPIKNPDVYPSGRGMYAFDPRLIPTVAASVKGSRAADLLLAAYGRQHGSYPETAGIVLWGFETMATGGDSIAMILSLLGVRIQHKKNPWFKELDIIPLEELGRPRIDVAITICGIFRDTFRTHIALLERAIDMVARLDEPPERNFVRAHYLKLKESAGDAATARIFGPSPTEYGTSMRTLVETGVWNDEKELVGSYDDSMSYAYFRGKSTQNKRVFSALFSTIDLVAQERDRTEYEITDLDHYYEFFGGLARSIEDKKGEKVDMLIVDGAADELVVDDVATTITRATRTRMLNPRWLDGMLQHEFHGAQQIKDRMENLLGFAATTHAVADNLFDDLAERLILDDEMRQTIEKNNPYAALRIAETFLESHNRDYWDADEELIRKLREQVLALEGMLE